MAASKCCMPSSIWLCTWPKRFKSEVKQNAPTIFAGGMRATLSGPVLTETSMARPTEA